MSIASAPVRSCSRRRSTGSSTIVSPYRDSQGRIVGVLGVIGPTRLNYARIIPMVDYTARVVSKVLAG